MSGPPAIVHARVVRGSGGGPDKTILESARYLDESGYLSRCLYLRDPGDRDFSKLEAKARQRGVDIQPIDDKGPLDPGIIARVREALPRQPLIWHGHDYKTNLLGLLLGKRHPRRLVTTVHGWVHQTARTPLYYAIDRLCLPRYQGVLCVSQDLLDRSLAAGVAPDRCWLVPNAIDTEEYRRTRSLEAAREQLGRSTPRTVVGAVGRLSTEKGFDHLIRAASSLIHQGHDLEIWIIGEGEEEARLRELAAQERVESRVWFSGYQTEVRTLFEAMEIFVLSSLREGLPNALLEAMSMEVPVVSTRIAGVPTVLTDRVNGLLVEPGDHEELALALDHLLRDRTSARELATRARETIENQYSFSARMSKVMSIYEAVGLQGN